MAASRWDFKGSANTVSAWNPDSGECLGVLVYEEHLSSLAVSPDGLFLLLGTVKAVESGTAWSGLLLVRSANVRGER